MRKNFTIQKIVAWLIKSQIPSLVYSALILPMTESLPICDPPSHGTSLPTPERHIAVPVREDTWLLCQRFCFLTLALAFSVEVHKVLW